MSSFILLEQDATPKGNYLRDYEYTLGIFCDYLLIRWFEAEVF